ncbi:MAG: hypothetical protein JO166_12155 [Deltaproteobacteria bacterium]|nr:hypothetical protein [Deltaproteobacteria bacterium]
MNPEIRKAENDGSSIHRHNPQRRQGLADLRDYVGADEASWPYLVSAIIGASGIALASFVGAAELAVGVAAAYVAYDVIARGVPLWDAIKQAEEEIRV